MTIKELTELPNYKIDTIFVNDFTSTETDNDLKKLCISIFNLSVNKYKNFTILYQPDDCIFKLNTIFINVYNSLVMRIKMLSLNSSTYFKNITTWLETNKSEASYNTGYSGFNADGDFKKDTNTNMSSTYNPLTFLNYFGQDFKDQLDFLEKEIIKIMQTIY